MLAACSERFEGLVAQGVVRIADLDLRRDYPDVQADVTTAVLCLQFIPLEYRQHLVTEIYRHTLPGGAFIMVEKVERRTARPGRFPGVRLLLALDELRRLGGREGSGAEAAGRLTAAPFRADISLDRVGDQEGKAQAGPVRRDRGYRTLSEVRAAPSRGSSLPVVRRRLRDRRAIWSRRT
jgi:hypothetical protein